MSTTIATTRREHWRAGWKQFRRSRLALPGLVLLLLFVIAGLLAPVIAPYAPDATDLANVMSPPSAEHWFGTDELGRDIFTRILYGARISLMEGLLSVGIAFLIGVPLGVFAGYAGRKTDAVLMRLLDVLMAFPGVLLAIVIISILGPSLINAIIAVAVYTIPIFARFARGSTLALKEEPYIEACRAIGMSDLRILARHVFPNIAAPLFALATLRVGIAILTCASISFLGLGAQAPLPEWGAMLASSRTALLIAPHLAVFPGLAIILLVFSLNLFQDGLQLVLDPKARGR
ncbi:ABC transporter permease [Ottowia sp. VDI28]|uniref:ABC transporter permease n=1 Tax=Ottowia sp. VDI28 TaxID=3133968 RepID=UPI003C2E398B